MGQRIQPRSSLLSWSVSIVCLILLTVAAEAHVKLNVPRVRLPYFDSLSVNFTLQVDTPGCYRWTVSRSDIITISTADGQDIESDGTTGCFDNAVISTVPRVSPCCPSNAIVYAEEINTKEIVRCDVIIDKITSVSIVTTTKELHLEEAPSKFNVRGYGGKGNEFSTLEGVPFKWWLETPTADTSSVTDPQSIMRFLPFSESLYNTPASITALEARRLQGSQVLVEGLKTGSANVFAKIQDPLYKNIPAADVRIVVVANLLLEPHEVYVVPETTFPLRLLQVKHGKIHEIRLPSEVYSFEVSNTTVARYDAKTSMITTLAYGETKILAKDKHNLEDIEGEHPEALTAYIYVREPKFLSLTVKPYRNWALMIGQEYEVSVDVYDSENQKIYIGNNMFIKTSFESNFFRTDVSSKNGSYHVGTPIKTGTAKVNAELQHLKRIDGSLVPLSPAPRVQVEMEIFQRIAINPKEVVLPWDPNVQPKHEIMLTPSGGNGNFAWTTTNSTVVTVTQSGQAKTEWFGYANITAAMTINSNIKGHAKVYVLPPTSMKILDHIVEAEVGTAILVPLAFYGIRPDDLSQTPVSYSKCRNLPFTVEVEDPNFEYDAKTYYPHARPACAYLPVIGTKLGSSIVTVTYIVGDLVFTDSVTVSTFKPLRVVEPSTGVTVLAVGASRQLIFEGGPRPLLERTSEFSRQMNVENSTVAKSLEIKPVHGTKDDMYVYEVFCTEIGETLATLETGNLKFSQDRKPVSRTADVKVICGDPAKIYFKVETKIRDDGGSKCPHDLSNAQVVRVPVPNYEDTVVSVTVKDPKGRKFDNISSLAISWSSSEPILVFQKTKYIPTEIVPVNGYNVPGKGYQTLIPKGTSGNIEITAELTGYRKEALNHYNIYKNMKLSNLLPNEEYLYQRSMSMDLQLVADVSISPSSATLFNHPSSKSVLRIMEGSGYFEVSAIPSLILSIKYFDNNKTILVVPMTEGDATIVVKDLCLSGRPTAEVTIRVNGVGTIELDVVDKIQLSHEVLVNVLLYDKNGQKLTPKDLALIKLRPTALTADLIDVVPNFQATDTSHIQYRVKGKRIGQATLGFIADGPGRVSRSAVKIITVFPPLTVRPENLTILVGSVYQILARGGPQPDTLTNFSTGSGDKAAVTHIGLVMGRSIGATRIDARSVDRIPPATVYSEAHVDVRVVSLRGIRILAPLLRIQANSEMPLFAMGIVDGAELEPTVLLGGKHAILSFQWTVSNRETAEIQHVFQPYGLSTTKEDQVQVHLKAKQIGQIIVKLVANYSGQLFVDEVNVEVIDEFKFVNLDAEHRTLLMTPNSEISLKTNRDSSAIVSYAVQPVQTVQCPDGTGDCTGQGNGKPVVSVDKNGVVRTNDVIGVAVVLASIRETFGVVQTLALPVEVKSMSYLMINPKLPVALQSRGKVISLPRGISFPFTVSYHDNIGRAFDATNASPKLRPNRFDLTQISPGLENHTFTVQLVQEGRVAVKVYDEATPALKDFLVLSVGEAIDPKLPSNLAIVGEILCLSCSVKAADLQSGYWVSDPEDIMFLDSQNGLAVALAPGRVRIEYLIAGLGVITSIDLDIRSVSKISLESGVGPEYITNGGEQDSAYEIPVRLGDRSDNLHGSSCSQNLFTEELPVPFVCELIYERNDISSRVADTFRVRAVFQYDKARYACQITPLKNSHSLFYVSTVRSNLVLTVRMNSSALDTSKSRGSPQEQATLASTPLSIPFQPAVFVHSTVVHISSKGEGTVTITGLRATLDQLVFVPSDGSYLEVDKRGTSTNPFASNLVPFDQIVVIDKIPEAADTRSYKVRLLSSYWTSGDIDTRLSLSVISPSTKQAVQVPVKVKLSSSRSTPSYSYGLDGLFASLTTAAFWTLAPVGATLLTLFVVHIVWKQKNNSAEKLTSSEAVFLSSHSASTTPRGFRSLKTFSPSGSPSSGMGDSISPSGNRLYSTGYSSSYRDSPFQ